MTQQPQDSPQQAENLVNSGLIRPVVSSEQAQPPKQPKGLLWKLIPVANSLLRASEEARAELGKGKMENLAVAEASMTEVKEIQDILTRALNVLSSVRKDGIARDLNELRARAKAAKGKTLGSK